MRWVQVVRSSLDFWRTTKKRDSSMTRWRNSSVTSSLIHLCASRPRRPPHSCSSSRPLRRNLTFHPLQCTHRRLPLPPSSSFLEKTVYRLLESGKGRSFTDATPGAFFRKCLARPRGNQPKETIDSFRSPMSSVIIVHYSNVLDECFRDIFEKPRRCA